MDVGNHLSRRAASDMLPLDGNQTFGRLDTIKIAVTVTII